MIIFASNVFRNFAKIYSITNYEKSRWGYECFSWYGRRFSNFCFFKNENAIRSKMRFHRKLLQDSDQDLKKEKAESVNFGDQAAGARTFSRTISEF